MDTTTNLQEGSSNCPVALLVDLSSATESPESPEKTEGKKASTTESENSFQSESQKNTQAEALQLMNIENCENIESSRSSEKEGPQKMQMEDLLKEDIKLLDHEEFDFDLPVSPSTSPEKEQVEELDDEDEVFFGPVGFKETIASVTVTSSESAAIKPLSPLRPDQMVALFKEANTVACAIDMHSKKEQKIAGNKASPAATKTPSLIDQLDSVLKVRQSEAVKSPGSPLRRQGTFTVNSSPLHMLPQSKRENLPVIDKNGVEIKEATGGTTQIQDGVAARALRAREKLNQSLTTRETTAVNGDGIAATSNGAATECSDGVIGSRLTKRKLPQMKSKLQKPTPTYSQRERHDSDSSASSVCSNISNCSNSSQRSGLKAPTIKTKLALLKPGEIQKKSLSMNKSCSKPGMSQSGPMKATKAVSGIKKNSPADNTRSSLVSNSSRLNRSVVSTPGSASAANSAKSILGRQSGLNQPRSSSAGSFHSTPVKPEKQFLPKRLAAQQAKDSPATPPRTSSSNSSILSSTPSSVRNNRRSMLPTPSKRLASSRMSSAGSSMLQSPQSGRSGSSSSVFSSRSVSSSCTSPRADENQPPAKRRSLLQTPSFGQSVFDSPQGFQPRKSLVQHTPLHGAKSNVKPPSRWSPIRKRKALSLEDEAIQCTKRTK
ncbi:G2 and S phase-expressed protein 1 isoform X2 [Lingula anatina]|uniref:G2 and S phase-expressed protein 1 isoform X2 n=1 Tax=Lingula anatina TaxID=7574 RepID=A0A1S3JTJ2_LINAN|nr:G2 and S phase-expressed protein 1 isoform X2 [Lingula anatina]|eukprot:XP_013413685.1 G2 and S phase-expressed protein 1 isoform X2 [Lingula anatina]